MLSDSEREEMREDGRSARRRREFARTRAVQGTSDRSLDAYLRFLKGIREVFPFERDLKFPVTKLNRL